MKQAKVILAFIALFLLLLGGALVYDSSSRLQSAYDTARETERELLLQEEKTVSIVKALPQQSFELEQAIKNYEAIKDGPAKHKAFRDALAVAQKNMFSFDPTDPLKRRLADELAGGINRCQISERFYSEAVAAYNIRARGAMAKAGRWLNTLPEQLGD